MASFPSGLVWLASYPKSGNTWMRVLLANLLSAREEPADINNLSDHEPLMGRWRFADDMLVDPDLLHWRELQRIRPIQCDHAATSLTEPFFCKTHDRFEGQDGQPVLGKAARAALYLVRDPRDVAISLAHHASISVDDAIDWMNDPTRMSGGELQLPYLLGDWSGHVQGWTEQALVPTLILRYENMRRDTAKTVRDVVAFLGGQADAAEIHRAVHHSSLEELQRQEATKGFRESRPGQERFFRSGRVGEWRDVLNPAQLQAIEGHFAPTMLRWGYDLSC